MDMLQSQKVVPEDLSSPSSRKYRVSDQDRTASGKVLQRKDSFSTLGASEETIYKQLSAVYLDPVFLRYADAGAEKDIKDGQAQAANPYVKKMEHSFAIINAQRYRGLVQKVSVLMVFAIALFALEDFNRIRNEGSTQQRVTVLAIKLGFMLPSLMVLAAFSYSSFYIKKSHYIEPLLLLGLIVVVLWGATRNSVAQTEKDIRAFFYMVYILFCFMFTHCRCVYALMMNLCAVFTFAIWTSVEPTNTFQDSVTYTSLLALGVAVAFYTSYNQEMLARQFHLQKACRKVQEKMLKKEQDQSQKLLSSMLPHDVLAELQSKGQFGDDGQISGDTIAKDFPDVTVLFCMVNDFADITGQLPPHLVVTLLNAIYIEFDKLVDQHDKVYKVETVGEVYLCATGIPRTSNTHAAEAADYALAMIECMPTVRENVVEALRAEGIENCDELGTGGCRELQIKVGLDSGPLVTGVIGKKNPRYKMFGDVVNTASRMESKSIPGSIQVSPSAWARLDRIPKVKYLMEKRTPAIEFKGKGVMQTYFLRGKVVTNKNKISKQGPEQPKDADSVKHKTASWKIRSGNNPVQMIVQMNLPSGLSEKQRRKHRMEKAADRFVSRMAEQEAAKQQMSASKSNMASVETQSEQRRNKKVIAEAEQKMRRRSLTPGASEVTLADGATTELDISTSAAEQVMEKVHKRHQQQARAERWRALQVFKQLNVVERTSLPLAQQLWLMFGNHTQNGGSESCQQNEAMYVAVHFPADSKFVRYSALVWLTVQVIFVLFDWVVYVENPQTNASGATNNTLYETQVAHLQNRALIAWVAVAPIVLFVLGLTLHGFRDSSLDVGNPDGVPTSGRGPSARHIVAEESSVDQRLHCTHRMWFKRRRLLTVLLVWATGLGCIGQTLVSKEPKYMLVAFFIVWQYNINNTLLPLWVSIFTALAHSVLYVAASMLTPGVEIESSALLMHGFFLFFFSIVMAIPAFNTNFFSRVIHNNRVVMDASHLLLAKEQMKGTALLNSLLPKSVVARFKAGQQLIADQFDQASVVFTDMKGFTKFTQTVTPTELVTFLNQMFSSFDVIGTEHDLYKVEIIGDAYYAVAGCPTPRGDHAYCASIASLKFLWELPEIRKKCGDFINYRIGVHTGPVVAGVVGLKDPRYHLFGDTVNLANDMESHGVPGWLQISKDTYDSLHSQGAQFGKPMNGHGGVSDFHFQDRGIIQVKGRGPIHTYIVSPSPQLHKKRAAEGLPIPNMDGIEEPTGIGEEVTIVDITPEPVKAKLAVKGPKIEAVKKAPAALDAQSHASASVEAKKQSKQYAAQQGSGSVSHTPVDQIQLGMAGVGVKSSPTVDAVAAAGGAQNAAFGGRSVSEQRQTVRTAPTAGAAGQSGLQQELLDDNRKLASILHDTECERDRSVAEVRRLQAERQLTEDELRRARIQLQQQPQSEAVTVRSLGAATAAANQEFNSSLPPLGSSLGRPRTAGDGAGVRSPKGVKSQGLFGDSFVVASQTSNSRSLEDRYSGTNERGIVATGSKLQALLEVISPQESNSDGQGNKAKGSKISGPSIDLVPNGIQIASVPQLLSLSEVRKLQRLKRQLRQPFLSLLLSPGNNPPSAVVPEATSTLVARLEGAGAMKAAATTVAALKRSHNNNYTEDGESTSTSSAVTGYGSTLTEYEGWWGLDVFEVEDWSQQGGLQFLSHSIFSSYDFFFENVSVSEGTDFTSPGLGLSRNLLLPFLEAIECGYNLCHNQSLGGERNPYHNSLHAASVLVDVHYFLRQGQLLLLPGMQQWEVLAMVFAALIHDYRHPATSNNFEAATLSERAMIYNDISVLENYHLSESFKVTRDPAFAIFEGMEMTTYQQMRGMVVELVLSTDLKQHFAILASAREAFGREERDQTFSSRMLLTLAFKASDVAHAAKSTSLHKAWSDRIMSEFFLQGDRERQLGLKISPFMDSTKKQLGKCQTGFIDFLCAPLYQLLAQAMADHLGAQGLGASKGLCTPAQLEELAQKKEDVDEAEQQAVWTPKALPLCMAPVMTHMRQNRAMWARVQAQEEEAERKRNENVVECEE